MKTYVLILSTNFPKTHPRAGEPTNFFPQVNDGAKLHTIRGNYKLWEKKFKAINEGKACLSVRFWSGKPYRSPQVEVFNFDRSHGIGLEKLESISPWYTLIMGKHIESEDVAKNDGLVMRDFAEWFKKAPTDKPMAIIHFSHFRYSDNKRFRFEGTLGMSKQPFSIDVDAINHESAQAYMKECYPSFEGGMVLGNEDLESARDKGSSEYIPYGDEWVKEMSKCPKKNLVEMIKRLAKAHEKQKQSISVDDVTHLLLDDDEIDSMTLEMDCATPCENEHVTEGFKSGVRWLRDRILHSER